MSPRSSAGVREVVVDATEPRKLIDLRELVSFRDLFLFLVWREIRVRYAQSALGIGWAVAQPLATMVVFTLIFGTLVGVESDGQSYSVFAFVAVVPWTYFANASNEATRSLSTNSNMVTKIYFPRILLPLASVTARLVDFAIALVILLCLLPFYGKTPDAGLLLVAVLAPIMVASAAGVGLWLTALSVQFRDVNHAAGFAIQLLMYAAPVVYPASLVPESWQLLYAANPMVGVIEGFRAVLLDSRPVPWDFIAIGASTAALVMVTGMLHFRRKERLFADVA